jgi:hypothetical protein
VKHLSLSQRLGNILSILGMLLALVPLSTRPARSLHQMGRLRIAIALATIHVDESSTCVLPSCPSPSCEPIRDQESDQESNDTEDLAETFTWSEAITDRRTVQGNGVGVVTALGSLAKPSRALERTRSALQRSRVLPLLAADASGATTRLCRFTC